MVHDEIYLKLFKDEGFDLFIGGNPESAAQLLEKAAKLLETKSPDEALALYSKAADTVGCEDRPKEASEYMAKVAKLQVLFVGQFCTLKYFKRKLGDGDLNSELVRYSDHVDLFAH